MTKTTEAMAAFSDAWPVLRVVAIAVVVTAVICLLPIAYNEWARMRHDRKQEKLKILADDDNFFSDLLDEFKRDPSSFFFKKDGWAYSLYKAHKYDARHKHSNTEKTYYTPGYLGTEV